MDKHINYQEEEHETKEKNQTNIEKQNQRNIIK